jgi:FixJ family two-component response regulator
VNISDAQVVSVIDDDDSMRSSVRRLLSSLGYRVETFESAEAFIRSAHRENTCCLVLDLRMPGMNGDELLLYLTSAGTLIPTIILTAHADSLVRQRLRALGALAVLGKPFKGELLLNAVSTALAQKP